MTISACCWNLLSATVAASRNQVAACMFILATARSAINRRAIFGKLQRRHIPRPIVATMSRPTWPTLCRLHWFATLSNAMPRTRTISTPFWHHRAANMAMRRGSAVLSAHWHSVAMPPISLSAPTMPRAWPTCLAASLAQSTWPHGHALEPLNSASTKPHWKSTSLKHGAC